MYFQAGSPLMYFMRVAMVRVFGGVCVSVGLRKGWKRWGGWTVQTKGGFILGPDVYQGPRWSMVNARKRDCSMDNRRENGRFVSMTKVAK